MKKFLEWYWKNVQERPYDTTAEDILEEYRKDTCEHEWVTTEYGSQPYGHCVGCDRTVFNRDGKWTTQI